MVDWEDLSRAIVEGDGDAAFRLSQKALEEKASPADILEKGLVPGLQRVGDRFESGEFYLPELIVAGDAVAKALEQKAAYRSQ